MLKELVTTFAPTGTLVEELLPYRDAWNRTDELLKALIIAGVSDTCLQKLADEGLDLDRDVGSYTSIEYAAYFDKLPQMFSISVRICLSYRDQPMVQRYIKSCVYSLMCYVMDPVEDDKTASQLYCEWVIQYENAYRKMLHASLFTAVLSELGRTQITRE